jgi:hypothetical protein
MTQKLDDLPIELVHQLLAFRTQPEDGSETVDTMGFVKFVLDNMDRNPALLQLIKVNEDAVIKHVRETGNRCLG